MFLFFLIPCVLKSGQRAFATFIFNQRLYLLFVRAMDNTDSRFMFWLVFLVGVLVVFATSLVRTALRVHPAVIRFTVYHRLRVIICGCVCVVCFALSFSMRIEIDPGCVCNFDFE